MISVEVQNALEAARRVHGKFVFIPADASPELREALEGLAAEMKREVLQMPGESRAEIPARELAERDVPAIHSGDDRAFIQNLRKIAKGQVKVV